MKFDPWYFQRWAREQRLGNPTRKLILTSLAITVESSTGAGFMPQADLAEYAECSVRTVSEHLKALEATGYIARRRRFSKQGRRLADEFLLLAPGVVEWPDGDRLPPEESAGGAPPEESASGSPAQPPPEAQASEQELPIELPIERERAREPERDELAEVWAHYQATVPNGSRYKLDAQRRLLIRNALKVRTASECKLAITALAASDYHVEHGYLDLRYALLGGGRSPRPEVTIDRLIAQSQHTARGLSAAAGSATVGRVREPVYDRFVRRETYDPHAA